MRTNLLITRSFEEVHGYGAEKADQRAYCHRHNSDPAGSNLLLSDVVYTHLVLQRQGLCECRSGMDYPAGLQCEILRKDSQGQPVLQLHVGIHQARCCWLFPEHAYADHNGFPPVLAGTQVSGGQAHQVVLFSEHALQRRSDSILRPDAGVSAV